MTTPKTNPGNFFEDFRLGQDILHAIPRTVSEGDVALYIGLTGSRFALHSSDSFAQSLGLPSAPIDDMLAFHLIFGRTVADISLNAVANLGYAVGRFGVPLYAGDTIYAWSEVVEKIELPGRPDVGALRLRTIATKDQPCAGFPGAESNSPGATGKYPDCVVLDLDYTVLMKRRG